MLIDGLHPPNLWLSKPRPALEQVWQSNRAASLDRSTLSLLPYGLPTMTLESKQRHNEEVLEKVFDNVSANRKAALSSRSHFYSLPTELRIEIYELVLGVSPTQRLEVSICTDQNASSDSGRSVLRCSKQPDFRRDLGFFRVSKQTYRESLPIPYNNCTFYPLADPTLLAAFFGPMSDFARSNIPRLHLKPRPQKVVRLVGPRATLSEVLRGPSWSPACEKIFVLFPDLEEVLIHLLPIYGYGLGDGDQLDWIIRPLCRLKGTKKLLASVGNGSDNVKTPEMDRKWNDLVEKAESDATEYMASRARIMEDPKGWPSPYWIIKRRLPSP